MVTGSSTNYKQGVLGIFEKVRMLKKEIIEACERFHYCVIPLTQSQVPADHLATPSGASLAWPEVREDRQLHTPPTEGGIL